MSVSVYARFTQPAAFIGTGVVSATATAMATLLAGRGQLAATAARLKRQYGRRGCLTPNCRGGHFARGLCQACHRAEAAHREAPGPAAGGVRDHIMLGVIASIIMTLGAAAAR